VDARDQSNAPAVPAVAGNEHAPAFATAVDSQNIERQGARAPSLVRTILGDAGHAVIDIPQEIYQAGADSLHNIYAGLNPFSAEAKADFDKRMKATTPGDALAAYLESQKRLGRGLLGIPQFLGAPITGASRSLLGHPLHALDAAMRDLAVRIHGEDKIRRAEEARGDSPGGRTYDDAKATVDQLMMGLAPRGGGLRAPPAPMTRALPAPQETLALPPPRPQLALPAPPSYPALSGPPPGTQQSWEGLIHSGLVPEGGMVAYRTWGGETAQQGWWLSPESPASSSAAIRDLSLQPDNPAQYVSRVYIPEGTRIQWGRAASAFNQPGGGRQIWLTEDIPNGNYGPPVPLRPK
jgi:hypothetical protein